MPINQFFSQYIIQRTTSKATSHQKAEKLFQNKKRR